jgi:hypothetical protein
MRAIDKLVLNSRTVMVSAFGNSGEEGIFSGSTPATSTEMFAVGNVINNVQPDILMGQLVGGGKFEYMMAYDGSTPPPPPASFQLAVYPTADACVPVAGQAKCQALSGKYVLIQEGLVKKCRFREQVKNAETCGAVGTIVYAEGKPTFTPYLVDDYANMPSMSTTTYWANDLLQAMKQGKKVAFPPNTTHNAILPMTMDPSSSIGISGMVYVKPDIAAPGGNIYSAVASPGTLYDFKSGTSMASPQVAGAVALATQALRDSKNPNIRADWKKRSSLQRYMKRLFMSNASPMYALDTNGESQGVYMGTSQQGAGMLNALEAITTPLRVVLKNQLSGEWQTRLKRNMSISIISLANNIDKVSLSSKNALGVLIDGLPGVINGTQRRSQRGYNQPSILRKYPKVTWSGIAKGAKSVDALAWVDVSNPQIPPAKPGVNGQDLASMFGGYLEATITMSGKVRRILWPFGGLKGDFNNGLQKNMLGYIDVAFYHGNGSWSVIEDGHVFNMHDDGAKPLLVGGLNWPAAEMWMYIYPKGSTVKDEPFGLANYREAGIPRVADPFELPKPKGVAFGLFNGKAYGNGIVEDREVPDGDWFFLFKLLKARANRDLPVSYEYVQSSWFTIARQVC